MKRSSLRRAGSLSRKTPIRARRDKPRRSSRVQDEAYLTFVRTLPCAVNHLDIDDVNCIGPTDPHHTDPLTRDDDLAIPLCRGHHGDFHDATGFCKGWDKQRRVRWIAENVERTQRDYASGNRYDQIPF